MVQNHSLECFEYEEGMKQIEPNWGMYTADAHECWQGRIYRSNSRGWSADRLWGSSQKGMRYMRTPRFIL